MPQKTFLKIVAYPKYLSPNPVLIFKIFNIIKKSADSTGHNGLRTFGQTLLHRGEGFCIWFICLVFCVQVFFYSLFFYQRHRHTHTHTNTHTECATVLRFMEAAVTLGENRQRVFLCSLDGCARALALSEIRLNYFRIKSNNKEIWQRVCVRVCLPARRCVCVCKNK